jgi:hypothetical protein
MDNELGAKGLGLEPIRAVPVGTHAGDAGAWSCGIETKIGRRKIGHERSFLRQAGKTGVTQQP